MAEIHCLPPVLPVAPVALILGSMPGRASLDRAQYYAHPRNALWPILCAHWGCDLPADYAARVALAMQHGIALSDVLATCERVGSLDQAIAREGRLANPIDVLLRDQPTIRHVLLNGAAAARWFKQYFPQMQSTGITLHALPSTSPAYASLSFEDKCARWLAALHGVAA